MPRETLQARHRGLSRRGAGPRVVSAVCVGLSASGPQGAHCFRPIPPPGVVHRPGSGNIPRSFPKFLRARGTHRSRETGVYQKEAGDVTSDVLRIGEVGPSRRWLDSTMSEGQAEGRWQGRPPVHPLLRSHRFGSASLGSRLPSGHGTLAFCLSWAQLGPCLGTQWATSLRPLGQAEGVHTPQSR